MNEPDYSPLREKNWRRPLTPAERAELRRWLAAHPEEQGDWQAEAELSKFLTALPDVPVPSNFTARVLQEVERQKGERRGGAYSWDWFVRLVLPRVEVTAAVLVTTGVLTVHQHETVQRIRLARSVAVVSEMNPLPSPDVLRDFEAVRQLNQPAQADVEMLALMQ
jgi:anti-sigma factor RsiW